MRTTFLDLVPFKKELFTLSEHASAIKIRSAKFTRHLMAVFGLRESFELDLAAFEKVQGGDERCFLGQYSAEKLEEGVCALVILCVRYVYETKKEDGYSIWAFYENGGEPAARSFMDALFDLLSADLIGVEGAHVVMDRREKK